MKKNTIDTDRDRMPPEVATELLCDPKVKLSGSARRACQRARWIIYPSKRPIVRPVRLPSADEELAPGDCIVIDRLPYECVDEPTETKDPRKLPYEYVDEPKEPVNHIARKARQASARQLLHWCVRLKRHRRTAQQRWQKLTEAKEKVTDPRAKAAIQKSLDAYDALVKNTIEPRIELFEAVLAERSGA